MKVKRFHFTGGCLLVSFLLFGLNIHSAHAAGFMPYKVDMSRTDPKKPIRKSAIMTKIRKEFPGRILSIREDQSGGDDCHIVKSMGNDGELRIIEVACDK